MLGGNLELESVCERLIADAAAATGIPVVALHVDRGRFVIEGELPSLAAKKRVLGRAATIAGAERIVDRLQVAPGHRLPDSQIRDRLLKVLIDEPAFSILAIQERTSGRIALVRHPCKCSGVIEYGVRDGVVFLGGLVPGLGHKRLAGVLAWWVPGVRDVVNSIDAAAAETDDDEDILDAVQLAIDKDPQLHGRWIRILVSNRVVTLGGQAGSEAQKDRAESDAWCVMGVRDVVNRLTVRP